jgi:hypothetical protein
MKKAVLFAIAVCFAWPAHGAETGEIVELFGCVLKDGKSMADFDAAASAWQKDMEKIDGVKNYFAAVLVPYRAKSDYDLVWLGLNPNLNDWAKAAAIDYTALGKATQARWDSVATCDSGLYFGSTLYEGLAEGKPGDPPAAVEAYLCDTNDGKTTADVVAAEKAAVAATNAIKARTPELAKYSTYRYRPWLAESAYDTIYLTVNHDVTAFAASNTAWQTSTEGQAADAAIAGAFTCDAGLWFGHIVHEPAPPPKN